MPNQQDFYGLDSTEIIIRINPDDVNVFNKHNDFSLDQIKQELNEKEIECFFQKIGEEEHRIIVPLFEGQFHVVVKEHFSGTYELVVHNKIKTSYRSALIIPESNYYKEEIIIRLIDINDRGRATDEFDELFKRVDALDSVSNINVQNQQNIWSKWIEAQQAIINNLQKYFKVKEEFRLKPIKNDDGNISRYQLEFLLANEMLPEYKKLEVKLREYEVDCHFDVDGSVELTYDDIERVLDPIIENHFNEDIERHKELSAIIKIKNRVDIEINRSLKEIDWNAYATLDFDSGLLVISNSNTNEIRLPKEIIEKYKLVRNGIIGTISKRNQNGRIERETFPVNLWNGVYGRTLSDRKEELKNKLITLRRKYFEDGYSSVKFYLGELYSYDIKDYNETHFDKSFWDDLKRDFISYEEILAINEYTQTISIDFETKEELEDIFNFLKGLQKFRIVFSPLNSEFKFKVKTNVIAKKTEKEKFLEKLKKLGGAEFIVEVEQEGKRWNQLFYLGKLNSRESDIRKLVLNIPNFLPWDKDKAKVILKFLKNEKRPKISQIRPNLSGDEAKIGWLKNAIKKITASTEAPNGISVNERLGEFIFDTSKATPIHNQEKVTENSEFYWEVKNNELLNLNESQLKAVLAAIHCDDLALLQGPPGTGKTTVIAEIIWQIISKDPSHKILLTSETNLAVDNALDRLLNIKGKNERLTRFTTLIKPLRFGKIGKLDEEGAKYSVIRIKMWVDENNKIEEDIEPIALEESDELLEKDDEDENLNLENNAVQDWMKRIASRAKIKDPKYAEALKDWALDLSFPKQEVREIFADKYFEYANVVGSTCSSSGSPKFMWNIGGVFSNEETEELNRINYLTTKTPFFNSYSEEISKYPIPENLKSEFFNLIRSYKNDYRIVSNFFRKKEDERTDGDLDTLHELVTIDGSKIKKDKHSNKLLSYQQMSEFGKEFIAPFVEPKVEFDTVIMDEASKATPPELLLPLCFGKRSIVIGDHRQLPPMLHEKDFREALIEADAEELANEIDSEFTATSQFERMILNPNISDTIISRCNIQYRMHPDINKVIHQFYIDEGGLEPAPELIEHADSTDLNHMFSRHHGLYLPEFIDSNTHTIWVDVKSPEMREGTSVINEGEANAVRTVVELLKKAEGFDKFQKHWEFIKDEFKRIQEKQIGIISFYGAQKRLLKRSLAGVNVPLKINTVDRFQGMERNIVIVSTVRSNRQKRVGNKLSTNSDSGFAKSPQRLNVALSRARRLLIVVGNKDFFSSVKDTSERLLYKNAIEEIEKNGRIINFDDLKKKFNK